MFLEIGFLIFQIIRFLTANMKFRVMEKNLSPVKQTSSVVNWCCSLCVWNSERIIIRIHYNKICTISFSKIIIQLSSSLFFYNFIFRFSLTQVQKHFKYRNKSTIGKITQYLDIVKSSGTIVKYRKYKSALVIYPSSQQGNCDCSPHEKSERSEKVDGA